MRNKKIVVFLGVLLIVLVSSCLLLKMEGKGKEGGALRIEMDSSNGGLSNAVSASNAPGRIRQRANRISREFSENHASMVVETLTAEEGRKIAEALQVAAKLQEFLDDGDDANALIAARQLATHPNREVRLMALEAMDWIGAAAVADIVEFFTDTDTEIRQEAEDVFEDLLDEIGDSALKIDMLEISLRSSNPALRMEALDELVFLPDHLSFPVIAVMLGDTDENVKNLARENLEFISEEEFSSEQEAMDWFNRHKDDLEALERE